MIATLKHDREQLVLRREHGKSDRRSHSALRDRGTEHVEHALRAIAEWRQSYEQAGRSDDVFDGGDRRACIPLKAPARRKREDAARRIWSRGTGRSCRTGRSCCACRACRACRSCESCGARGSCRPSESCGTCRAVGGTCRSCCSCGTATTSSATLAALTFAAFIAITTARKAASAQDGRHGSTYGFSSHRAKN